MRHGTARPALRRLAPVSVLALSLLAILSLLPLAPLPPTRAALPSKTSRTIPETDVNPFGANFFLHHEAEPWKIEKTLQLAREANIGWAKQHFPWEEIELRKGQFWNDRLNKTTWEKYDLIVDVARRNNIQIIARLDRPPAWSRRDNSLPQRPPDNYEDFGDFVHAVVSHFKGRVYYYQIWNEPNIFPEWGNQPVDPAAYTRLLKIAHRRAKEADPAVRILSAPLAQTLERNEKNVSELVYLEEMYRHGARGLFDILFANGYGFERAPDDPPDPAVLNFARVRLVRELMERNGDGEKAVWFNEFGWNASPENFRPDQLVWGRVTEREQADYTAQAIRDAREQWPWVGVFNVWYFRQAGQIEPERSDYYFRMVDVGFTPRLVYQEIKRASESILVAGAGAHQDSNPAISYGGEWLLVAREDATSGTLRETRVAGASATVRFRGSDIAVVTELGPDGGKAHVTIDGREANLIGPDRQGRSTIELASPSRQPQARIPIATGLGAGEHVLRMALATGEGVFRLDGFAVEDRPAGLASTGIWLAGLIVITSLIGLTAYIGLRRRPTQT